MASICPGFNVLIPCLHMLFVMDSWGPYTNTVLGQVIMIAPVPAKYMKKKHVPYYN